MKTNFSLLLSFLALFPISNASSAQSYKPTAENIEQRKAFTADRFGIFLHWGIYSTYAQGEWYLQTGELNKDEYAQAARGFYPINFNAEEWVKAFKEAGARYICFTTRHHDGFSMFKTAASPYNIVDGTPFKRDVVDELAKACQKEGLSMHLYYSLLDWIREDYPIGKSGKKTGRKGDHPDYASYFNFMKSQIGELLQNYGPIRALWFDGYWDHPDGTNFDWRMKELYDYIHQLQPACLVGNNHHRSILPGEDFQMFERDLPGENKSGYSPDKSAISNVVPLEMCETMNGMWGYKVADLNYMSSSNLASLLVKAASKGSNLLINIGPRPNGELPDLALDRLRGMGQWMKQYGETVYGTTASDIPDQPWGVVTCKGKERYLHVFSLKSDTLTLPQLPYSIKTARIYKNNEKLKFKVEKNKKVMIYLPEIPNDPDYIIALTIK